MSEPEPSPAIRRLFEELEAEFEASLRREAEQQTVAALRAQAAETLLWEALARRVGSEVAVQAGPRWFRGTLVASYPDFFVVRDRASRAQYLVRLGPAVSVSLPIEQEALRLLPSPPRYRFILELLAVDPPHPAPSELDRRELTTAYQGVDLRDPHIEDRRDVFERIEARLDARRWHTASWGWFGIGV